jgi:hypothetical protein
MGPIPKPLKKKIQKTGNEGLQLNVTKIKKTSQTNAKVEQNSKNIATIQQQINELNQKNLNCKIEITGLQLTQEMNANADLISLAASTIRHFNININQERDIVDAYIKTRKDHILVLVIVFIHEAIARKVLRAKYGIKNDKSGIWFSEALTLETLKIRREAINMKKNGIIEAVNVRNGKVNVKLPNINTRYTINTIEELQSLSNFSSHPSLTPPIVAPRRQAPIQQFLLPQTRDDANMNLAQPDCQPETWINNDTGSFNLYQLDGFSLHQIKRDEKRGGGINVYLSCVNVNKIKKKCNITYTKLTPI